MRASVVLVQGVSAEQVEVPARHEATVLVEQDPLRLDRDAAGHVQHPQHRDRAAASLRVEDGPDLLEGAVVEMERSVG
ncbi:MAG: hypothetical protein ACR2HA_13185 [Nocardioides sp.]